METIASNFINTGLSCTITIVGADGTSYVSAAAMTEVGNGWYKYDFSEYDKNTSYLISTTDGTNTQSITNELDSYSNKDDYKGGSRGAIVYGADEATIESRFKTMMDEFKKDRKPHNDLSPSMIKKLEAIEDRVSNIYIPEPEIVEIDYDKINNMIDKQIKRTDKSKELNKLNDSLGVIYKEVEGLKKDNKDMEDIISKLGNTENELKLTKKQLKNFMAKENSKKDRLSEIKKQMTVLESMVGYESDDELIDAIEELLKD